MVPQPVIYGTSAGQFSYERVADRLRLRPFGGGRSARAVRPSGPTTPPTRAQPAPLAHAAIGVRPDTSTRAALDARMRPLAGMGAHGSGSLVREVPRLHPVHIEALSALPVRRCSARSPRNRVLRGPCAGFLGVETGALVDVSGLDRVSPAGRRGRPRPSPPSCVGYRVLRRSPVYRA